MYCKKFRGNIYRHNRRAISVRAVWVSGRTEIYHFGEDRTSVRISECPDIFLILSLIFYTMYTVQKNYGIEKFWTKIDQF